MRVSEQIIMIQYLYLCLYWKDCNIEETKVLACTSSAGKSSRRYRHYRALLWRVWGSNRATNLRTQRTGSSPRLSALLGILDLDMGGGIGSIFLIDALILVRYLVDSPSKLKSYLFSSFTWFLLSSNLHFLWYFPVPQSQRKFRFVYNSTRSQSSWHSYEHAQFELRDCIKKNFSKTSLKPVPKHIAAGWPSLAQVKQA